MVNTFRYETKQTRSFIRVREIHFFEAHTAHIDEDDASRQIEQDLDIVDRLMHHLCLPVLKAKRPVWDTFPGAWYTIGIDAIMPNGRTLQVASCHHYRDQWAKAFDITYETKDATQATCIRPPMGCRALAGCRGRDARRRFRADHATGYRTDSGRDLSLGAQERHRGHGGGGSRCGRPPANAGLRVKVDDRDLHPGQKYYDWEIKGVPLRLEVGPRRGTGQRLRCTSHGRQSTDLNGRTRKRRSHHPQRDAEELRTRAYAHVDDVVKPLPAWGEDGLESPVEEGRIYELAFNGSDADAERLERATGMGFLGDATEPYAEPRPCHATGEPTTRRVLMSRSY